MDEMSLQDRALLRLAQESENVASGLYIFREHLPRHTTMITGIISELWNISTSLRELYQAQADPNFIESSWLIRDDLQTLSRTLEFTLDAIKHMFSRSRDHAHAVVWNDLCYRMEEEEGLGIVTRLDFYRDFLAAQIDILNDRRSRTPPGFRRQLNSLLVIQENFEHRAHGRATDESVASTARPQRMRPPPRPQPQRLDTPLSPMSPDSFSDFNSPFMPPPMAPEAPHTVPMSPTFTSNSSHTLDSSHTSYTSEGYYAPHPTYPHWAQSVFDGQNPSTPFHRGFQLEKSSRCFAEPSRTALFDLQQDGYVLVLELPFAYDRLCVRLYLRPADGRARVLLVIKAANDRELYFCKPLTTLKIVRSASMLQLCRVQQTGRFELWARLNFSIYERMVLFYCTFVAMKRQDIYPIPHEDLYDRLGLCMSPTRSDGEIILFASQIVDGRLVHALRLFRDSTSGVVRLEACAFRGPMKDVPIWSAFVSKYADDPDWLQLEREGTVSLAKVAPPPYVFMSRYRVPMNRKREYVLQFVNQEQAELFVQAWTRLCNSSR